jgi:hypothetical protein
VEDVACNQHEIWLQLNGFVNYFSKSVVEVLAAYIQVVLSIAKVQVGDVNKAEWFQRASSCFL